MKKSKPDSWLTDQIDQPVPEAPGSRKAERRQRIYRWLLLGSFVLFPVALLSVVVLAGQAAGEEPPTAVAPEVRLDAPGRAAATTTLQAWLAAEPAPVPGGGRMLSWDGAETVVAPTVADDEAVPDVELHQFTITDEAGTVYTVTVPVAVDDVLGSRVLSAPSLVAVAPSAGSGWAKDNVWAGTKATTTAKSVDAAVKSWAEAFTSGDPDKLRITVADRADDHFYVPLSGVASVTASVGQAAFVDTGDETFKKDGTSPVMLANVTLEIVWAGAEPSKEQEPTTVTYDVLIHDADTAAPVIVSWGPTGAGLSLKPYDQAVVGREVVAASPAPDAEPEDDSKEAGE
ncbi:hypothetical protein [Agromyces subbeticus]|uniref:hypothetical protein n=1 Tax=Agromyces subbeticus TaxID=293890 RepID=UPI0003B7B7BC|nr:hypothetical protein [Agromyces subbeticus]